jgi:uncharacterized protein (DUF488 family)
MNADIQIFTIGHSNHPLDAFIHLLERNEIESLVDVRRFPSSRRLPHFNRANLPTSLKEAGIGYHWLNSLGGRRDKIAGFDSPNVGIADKSFRNYADYMLGDEFRQGVERLREIAASQRTTIMCAEADFQQCHRRLVSDYLVANGIGVQHILGGGDLKAHKLAHGAKVTGSCVTYPERLPLFDSFD